MSNDERKIPEDDPVWQAILRAPIDDESETAAEIRAMAAATTGPFTSHDVVMAWIDARRQAEEAGEPDPTFEEFLKKRSI